MSFPKGLSFDSRGRLMVAEYGGGRIRRIDFEANRIETVAGGNGGGPALEVGISTGNACRDPAGNFYFTDTGVVRRLDAATRNVSVLAGDGTIGNFLGTLGVNPSRGDGGPATAATFWDPLGIVRDIEGNLYVHEAIGLPAGPAPSQRIRRIDSTTGAIATFLVLQYGTSSLAIDPLGSLYLPAGNDHRVRRIGPRWDLANRAPVPAPSAWCRSRPPTSSDHGPRSPARSACRCACQCR